jgi:enediyne biosynthesis protein E4
MAGPLRLLLWFNPAVSDDQVAPAREVRQPSWMSRRTALISVAAAGVVAAVSAVTLRSASDIETGSTEPTPPHFVDQGDAAGIQHAYTGGFEHFVGGGVATFDCNDDGRSELYVAGGSDPAVLLRNDSPVGGALRFDPLASPVTDLTSVTGAYPIDIDSDDRIDLVVLGNGRNVLLRGLGDCRFEAANDRFGIDSGDRWTTAFSATWEGTNALPTLAFGNYLALESVLAGGDDLASGEYRCDDSALLRPAGDRYGPPLPLTPGYCTLSMLFSDWGRSGRRDLRITNDRHYYADGQDQLWRLEFGEPPRQFTEADGWRPLRVWGMGIASQDLTGDGYPEVFVTSQGDNKLQTLDGDPTQPAYRDIALRRGVTAQRPAVGDDVLPSTAWHPEFDDVNNDGLVDLFITKGNVEAQPDFATRDPNNLLIGRSDGTFVEGSVEAGIVTFDRSRGAALVDLNVDGMLDLVVVHRNRPLGLWRNVGYGDADTPEAMGGWVAIDLHQPAPNVDAIGAWVEVRTAARTLLTETTIGGGHVGGQLGWIHFGLGDADNAEVRVTWPDGEVGPWIRVDADQFVTIERGATEATRWVP